MLHGQFEGDLRPDTAIDFQSPPKSKRALKKEVKKNAREKRKQEFKLASMKPMAALQSNGEEVKLTTPLRSSLKRKMLSSPVITAKKEKVTETKESCELYHSLIETTVMKTFKEALNENKGEFKRNDPKIQKLFQSIGQVDFNDSRFLFEQKSKQLSQHVHEFQLMFFTKHAGLLEQVQKEKAKKRATTPSNITHLLVEINGGLEFIVAPSRSANPKDDECLVEALEDTCRDYNKENSQNIPCHVLTRFNKNYNDILQDLLEFLGLDEAEHKTRDCAEKLATWEMAKHFREFPNTKIISVMNIENYPREEGIEYGKGDYKHVSRKKDEEKAGLAADLKAGAYQLQLWSCCPHCQKIAPAYLATMAAMQEIGLSASPTKNAKFLSQCSPAKITPTRKKAEGPPTKRVKLSHLHAESPTKDVRDKFSDLGLGSVSQAALSTNGFLGAGAGVFSLVIKGNVGAGVQAAVPMDLDKKPLFSSRKLFSS